jgi:formiminotetrahydrofolate cyclodeaminase
MSAHRDKTLSEDEKAAAVERATIRAGEEPLRVARACRDVTYLAETITTIGNRNAVTDAASAALMARAAVQAASLNVQVNGSSLSDRQLAYQWKQEVESLEAEVDALAEAVVARARDRGGI